MTVEVSKGHVEEATGAKTVNVSARLDSARREAMFVSLSWHWGWVFLLLRKVVARRMGGRRSIGVGGAALVGDWCWICLVCLSSCEGSHHGKEVVNLGAELVDFLFVLCIIFC